MVSETAVTVRLTRLELGGLVGAAMVASLRAPGTCECNTDAERARVLAITERVCEAWCQASRERRPFAIEVVEW